MIVACLTGLIWSCSKKIELVSATSNPAGLAYIKIVEFSPNFKGVTNYRDSFNVFVNGLKLNGGFLTYGAAFPTSTDSYAAVPPGSQTVRLALSGVNTPDSITLATFTKTLNAGTYYSFIITDSLLSNSESKQIFVQDNFVRSDTTHFTLRFVHAILNDTLGKKVDVYSTRLGANIFSNISPGTVTAFTTQPYNFVADTLIVRRAGIPFELARLSTVANPLARERAYTLIYKGTPNTTTAPKGRALVYFLNN